MKTKHETPENFDSAFVNVTLSAARLINGKPSINDLSTAAKGDWVMSEDAAKKIKYIYPVRKNQILGVFEVLDYTMLVTPDQTRVRFTLKAIFEGRTPLLESAVSNLTATNFVVKYF